MNHRCMNLLRLCLAAALSASCALRAEDAPPATGTPASEAPAVKPTAKDDLKKDEANAAASGLADDSKTVSGTPPVFPLHAEAFKSIEDGYDSIAENIDRKSGMMDLDLPALEACFAALRASSQEHLKQNVTRIPDASGAPNATRDLTIKDLLRTPEKYRGCVVKRTGILQGYRETNVSPNPSGICKVYRGQISNLSGELVSFRCIEPLPDGIKVGQPVQLVGIFLQRYAYLDRSPGDMLLWSPLVFARRLDPYTEIQAVASPSNSTSDAVAIVFFIGIGLACAAFFWMRAKDKVTRANYFSRIKEEREGPPGLFPKAAKRCKK